MGGKQGGLAVRMEGRCAPILANLSTKFRLRLALWEDPEQLSAMAHLFDLRFLLLGYFPAVQNTPSSIELLRTLRQTEVFQHAPCILVVRALEWGAYKLEAGETGPLGENDFLVYPDIELDAELPELIDAFLAQRVRPVVESRLEDETTAFVVE